ncbi:unnamed protein product [Calicophoron daubneyi]|uniref:C2H2-type domain-containing protein n=1 Tax=Calicophoron daubneyi TaxID=300641 RepID=A0AAV2TK89_CALDB
MIDNNVLASTLGFAPFKPGSTGPKEMNSHAVLKENNTNSPSSDISVNNACSESDIKSLGSERKEESMDCDSIDGQDKLATSIADASTDGKPQSVQRKKKEDAMGSANGLPSSKTGDDKRIRKFVCRYCSKAFSLMNVLKVHERIHTGEKPYVCEICEKAFNQSGSLNRHKNTHIKRSSDNRSYSCRFCPRQFLHSSQLQEHEASEHFCELSGSNNAKRASNEPPIKSSYNSKTGSPAFSDGASLSPSPVIRSPTNPSNSSTKELSTPLPLTTSCHDTFVKFSPEALPTLPFPVGLNLINREGLKTNRINLESIDKYKPRLPYSAVPTVIPPQNKFCCEICPSYFTNKTELDEHRGQHFLQQMGIPFAPAFGDNLSGLKPPNLLPSVPLSADRKGSNIIWPLLDPAHMQNLLNSSATDSSSANNTKTCNGTSPINQLPSLTGTLFPGAAAAAASAAALATLSHFFFPDPNANLMTGNSAFLTAFSNPELLVDPSNATQKPGLLENLSQTPFGQLLKAVSALHSTNLNTNSDNVMQGAVSGKGIVGSETTAADQEQGLNLALVKDRPSSPGEHKTILSPTKVNNVNTASSPSLVPRNPLSANPLYSHGPPNTRPEINSLAHSSPRSLGSSISTFYQKPGIDANCARFGNLSPKAHHMNVYGFEQENCSDPDGSSTNGSVQGNSAKRVSTECPSTSSVNHECDRITGAKVKEEVAALATFVVETHEEELSPLPPPPPSGERPFKCRYCGNAFSQNGTLKRHLQTCKAAICRVGDPTTPTSVTRSERGNSSSADASPRTAASLSAFLPERYNRDDQLEPSSVSDTGLAQSPYRSPRGRQDIPTVQNGAAILRSSNGRNILDELNELMRTEEILKRHGKDRVPCEGDDQSIAQNGPYGIPMKPNNPEDIEMKTEPVRNGLLSGETTQEKAAQGTLHQFLDVLNSVDATSLDERTTSSILQLLIKSGRIYGCSDCHTYFMDRSMYQIHRYAMHVENPCGRRYECSSCGCDQGDRRQFLAHFVRSHSAASPQSSERQRNSASCSTDSSQSPDLNKTAPMSFVERNSGLAHEEKETNFGSYSCSLRAPGKCESPESNTDDPAESEASTQRDVRYTHYRGDCVPPQNLNSPEDVQGTSLPQTGAPDSGPITKTSSENIKDAELLAA